MTPDELSDRLDALIRDRGWTIFSKAEKVTHLDTMTVRTEPGSFRAERLKDDASGVLQQASGTLEGIVTACENTDARLGASKAPAPRPQVQEGITSG